MSNEFFSRILSEDAAKVEVALEALLSDNVRGGEIARPARLLSAMRHGVLAGGKRMRPALVLETAKLFGGPEKAALRVGAALECVHCYSLVHDDLPAMDNDDLRRGRPTVHKAFDEASAILAGDTLLTYAFEILAADETELPPAIRITLVCELARASGLGGMAGGQALDLEAENSVLEVGEISRLQAMKTGALIRYACEAGAILSGVSFDDRSNLRRFGEIIGLAFQLRDDLLDLLSDSSTLGKAAGKDAAKGKGTLPSVKGIAWTEKRLRSLIDEAHTLLESYGKSAEMLAWLATYVATREK